MPAPAALALYLHTYIQQYYMWDICAHMPKNTPLRAIVCNQILTSRWVTDVCRGSPTASLCLWTAMVSICMIQEQPSQSCPGMTWPRSSMGASRADPREPTNVRTPAQLPPVHEAENQSANAKLVLVMFLDNMFVRFLLHLRVIFDTTTPSYWNEHSFHGDTNFVTCMHLLERKCCPKVK